MMPAPRIGLMKSARRTLTVAVGGALALFALTGCALTLPPLTAPTGAAHTAPPKVPDLYGSEFVTSIPFTQLAVGQCTDISQNTPIYDPVTILGCGKPHGSEVLSTFQFPAGDFPTESAMAAIAEPECDKAFTAQDPGWLSYVWVGPSSDEWKSGDRLGVCFAVDPNNNALTAPLSTLSRQPAPVDKAVLTTIFTTVAIAMGAFFLVGIVVGYLLTAIGLTRLFRKVGIPVWRAWVPYVQTWTLLRLGGQNGNWVLLSLLPVGAWATAVFVYISMYRIGIAFRKDAGLLILGIFLPFAWALVLGRDQEVYSPELLALGGYPPPREGYGAVPVA